MVDILDRVGAIQSENDDGSVNFFGYGRYIGDQPAPDGITLMGVDISGRKNPKILLDSGKFVWGFQCWWGPEDQVRSQIEGKIIHIVDV